MKAIIPLESMKNLRLFSFAMFLGCFIPVLSYAQGARFDSTAFTTKAINGQTVSSPISSPVITVCTSTATGNPCSPQVLTYTDQTLTTSCPGSTQVVLANSNICQPTGDVLGNFGFWVAPGMYKYTISGSGVAGQAYSLTVPVGTTSGGIATINTASLGVNTSLNNTFFGVSALGSGSVTGIENTALGRFALLSDTTGQDNTAIGMNTLVFQTGGTFPIGSGNTAIGSNALQNSTTGYYNDAVGFASLGQATLTGFQNDCMGQTSCAKMTTGHDNVGIGAQALNQVTTGPDNTCIGSAACVTQTTATQSTCVGTWCLAFIGTGFDNTALGHDSGRSLTTTAAQNIMIGSYTGYNCGAGLCGTQLATAQNCIVIGFQEYCTANNQTFWGNTSNTQLNIFADPANVSNGSGGISLNQPLQVPTDSLELNQLGTTDTAIRLFRAGTQKSLYGNEGTAGHILVNSAQDDFSIRGVAGGVNIGSDGNVDFKNYPAGVVKGINNIKQLTADASPIAATSPGTTVFTFGTLPINTNWSFSCKILYNQQTAAGGVGIAIQGATNAPTRLDAWGTIWTANAAAGAPTETQSNLANLNTTTATSVVTATPSAITTVFQSELNGTIQVGASASTLNILMFTQAGADTVTPKAGSFCSLF